MKMWVRSQLETRIILVDHLSATKTGTVLAFQGPTDEGVVVGKYIDQDRAIDVLNEFAIKVRMQHRVFAMPEE